MDINRASLDAMFRNYMVDWAKGIAWRPPVDLSFLISNFPSTTASNFYAWLNLVPAFREWLGDRIFKNLRSDNFEVKNRDWEDSVRIPAKDIDDDQFGVYSPVIMMMAQAWPQLLHSLVVAVLTGNPTIFTGSAFFANSHAYGDQTIDNLVTDALSEDAFNAAFLARAAYKWPNGETIPGTFTHLIVGEKNRKTGFDLVVNEYLSVTGGSTSSNPNKGKCQLVVLPELTGTYDDYWYLVDGSQPIKAIALQVRKTPSPLMDTDPATVARSGAMDFMADGRAAAAGTFPHLIYAGIL